MFEKKYDVVVIGAGIAGVAAALAAARAGNKTALVEKTILTGGLATTGLIYVYLPLCDGNGQQVTFGIAEELLQSSLLYGPGEVPAQWRQSGKRSNTARYRTYFSPASLTLALDEALQNAGVDVWLDTLFCQPILKQDCLIAIEVENKSGRGRLSAQAFVDATGDAEVAARAGAPCADGDNYLTIWSLAYQKQLSAKAVCAGFEQINMTTLGGGPTGFNQPPGSRVYAGINGADVSHFVLQSRKLLKEHWRAVYDNGAVAKSEAFPVTLPAMPQYRMIRHIVGATVITDNQHGRAVSDSLGVVADWRKPGFVWEVPYSALVPQKIRGLLVAGRAISCSGDAWDVMRVIPVAALTGEVAGIACSMAREAQVTPDALDVRQLQAKLQQNGIPLHLPELGLAYL